MKGFLIVLITVTSQDGGVAGWAGRLAWAALSLGVTLFVSPGIAIASERVQPVRRLIAPRTWAEWPPSRIRA